MAFGQHKSPHPINAAGTQPLRVSSHCKRNLSCRLERRIREQLRSRATAWSSAAILELPFGSTASGICLPSMLMLAIDKPLVRVRRKRWRHGCETLLGRYRAGHDRRG